ncbi:hypothetical protein J3458_005573 [Metarhizium acridum]|uniref:uncharacterized protein n=1 Tax=Metarhizium acridum TaxID=92637 RepID=UPI001C6BD442|nr:hypothetical protein J3458_005573 [Metarhizium acridum]
MELRIDPSEASDYSPKDKSSRTQLLALRPLHLSLPSVPSPKTPSTHPQVLRAVLSKLGTPPTKYLSPNDPIHSFYPMQIPSGISPTSPGRTGNVSIENLNGFAPS